VKIDPPEPFRPITRRGVCEGCRAGVDSPVRVYLTEDYRGHFTQVGAPVPLVRWHCAACVAAITATLPRPLFGGPEPEFRYATCRPERAKTARRRA
jgi:hypothetical protein